jgi:alkylhydroperoxidase family enzyme
MAAGTGEVSDPVFREARERFPEGEIVEIAAVAGLFSYFNRFNNALGVPPTEPSPLVEPRFREEG